MAPSSQGVHRPKRVCRRVATREDQNLPGTEEPTIGPSWCAILGVLSLLSEGIKLETSGPVREDRVWRWTTTRGRDGEKLWVWSRTMRCVVARKIMDCVTRLMEM